MRVTQNMLFNNIHRRVSNSNVEISKYQDQTITGKRYQMPSGDSLNATRALGLKTKQANDIQYGKNVDSGISYMTTVETTMSSVVEILTEAKTVSIHGVNAATAPEDRKILAAKVDQLLAQLYSLANTRNESGEYIFSGFKTSTMPFDPTDTTYTYAGDTSNIQREVSPGTKLTVNFAGSQVFGDGITSAFAVLQGLSDSLNASNPTTDTPATSGDITGGVAIADLNITTGVNDTLNLSVDGVGGSITIAQALPYGSAALLATEIQTKINAIPAYVAGGISVTVTENAGVLTITSNSTGITSTVNTIGGNAATNLGLNTGVGVITPGADEQISIMTRMGEVDTALTRAIEYHATIGARMASFDDWKSRLADTDITTASLISQAEDVDMTEAIMNLSRTQTAYQAILMSSANVMQMSLMDFLR